VADSPSVCGEGHRQVPVVLVTATLIGGVLQATPADASPLRTFVTMHSSKDDYIGGGVSRLFTDHLGSVDVSGTADGISVSVSGGTLGDAYGMAFTPPPGKELHVRTYLNAQRSPFRTAGHPGIDISGDGRGCNTISGRFDVRDIAFDLSGNVMRLRLLYEQHCEEGLSALFGEVVYRQPEPPSSSYAASDAVWFPDTNLGAHAPVVPVDVVGTGLSGITITGASITGLHAADYGLRVDTCSGTFLGRNDICQILVRFTPMGAGPRLGSLVMTDTQGGSRSVQLDGIGIGGKTSVSLQSDAGDWVGAGQNYDYDPSNATISASGDWGGTHGGINGNNGDWWSFDFVAPDGRVLAPGTTYDATRYPFNGSGGPAWTSPATGGGATRSPARSP
jgi:hypothetical protein